MEQGDDGCRVIIAGDLTFHAAAAFRDMAEGLAALAASSVEIDLSAVAFIDSAGLGMLLILRDLFSAPVRLRVGPGQVGRMLGMARFTDFFAVTGGELADTPGCCAQAFTEHS